MDDSTQLFDGGLGLDSITFLELILEVETELGVRLRDEDLSDDVLANLGAFIAHLTAIGAR